MPRDYENRANEDVDVPGLCPACNGTGIMAVIWESNEDSVDGPGEEHAKGEVCSMCDGYGTDDPPPSL